MLTRCSKSDGFGESWMRGDKGPDGKLSFTPTSDAVTTVNKLATLLTAGRMSQTDRTTIVAAYNKVLSARQRLPRDMTCNNFNPQLHNCAYCSRWYQFHSSYLTPETQGACVYARDKDKTPRCYTPAQVQKNKAQILCTGTTDKEKADSVLMAHKLALQAALKLVFVSSSFHSTNSAPRASVSASVDSNCDEYVSPNRECDCSCIILATSAFSSSY